MQKSSEVSGNNSSVDPSCEFRLNRNLLKFLHRHGEDILAYRYYVIARANFSYRSGIFSLDEFCDILHSDFGYKSLHSRPGNKRKPFKTHLYDTFIQSILFREAPDGRFILNSERKLLRRFFGTDKSSWYNIPGSEILKSKKLFLDFCIGMLLAGNKFRSNNNISIYCSKTVRRIQYATSRNHKNSTYIKQYNFIEDVSGTKKEIEKLRAELYNIHGISSPRPVRYNNEWVLRLNAPNSYRSQVLNGVKGNIVQQMRTSYSKTECWFIPVRENFRKVKQFANDRKKWFFKEGVYGINQYVRDNSRYLNPFICGAAQHRSQV